MDYKELIERLRNAAEWVNGHGRNTNTALGEICKDAADAFTALEAENAQLRAEGGDEMSLKYPCVHYEDGKCKLFSKDDKHIMSWCARGPCNYETPSNADRIRAMSDEEMAEFVSSIPMCVGKDEDKNCEEDGCKDCFLKWLQQPAAEVQK